MDSKLFFDILPKLAASRPERAFGRPESGFSRRAGRFSSGFSAFEGSFGALIARYGKISKIFSDPITVFEKQSALRPSGSFKRPPNRTAADARPIEAREAPAGSPGRGSGGRPKCTEAARGGASGLGRYVRLRPRQLLKPERERYAFARSRPTTYPNVMARPSDRPVMSKG